MVRPLTRRYLVSVGNTAAEFGQLGLGDTVNRGYPTLIGTLQGTPIVDVACGHNHTAAMSNTTVFIWGSNLHVSAFAPLFIFVSALWQFRRAIVDDDV